METLGDVLTYIDDFLPNSLTQAQKITLINAELRKVWKPTTKDDVYSFVTASSTPTYLLPDNVTIDMVKEVYVSNSTAAASSTTYYIPYKYAGPDEVPVNNQYYDAFDGAIGLWPIPDKEYPARIIHQEYPITFSSSDTETQFNINQDYVDIIKFRVMSQMAKSGRFPNVILANNYESDAKELERRMKVKLANDKARTPSKTWSYKEW